MKIVDRREKDRWHVGKEIPLALIFAMLTQTAVGVWWAATQSAKLDNLVQMVADFKSAQYTISDARRDQDIGVERDRALSRRLDMLEQDAASKRRL